MAAMYLLNAVCFNTIHGVMRIPSGRLVTDIGEQLEIMLADGQLWAATDERVATAARIVTNLRLTRGIDETTATQMMMMAAEQSLLATDSGAARVTDHYVPTLGQVTFPLSQSPAQADQVFFTVNGLLYEYGIDFVVMGKVLTWVNTMILASSDNAFSNYGV